MKTEQMLKKLHGAAMAAEDVGAPINVSTHLENGKTYVEVWMYDAKIFREIFPAEKIKENDSFTDSFHVLEAEDKGLRFLCAERMEDE